MGFDRNPGMFVGRGMIILLSRMTKLVRLATGALRRLSLAKKKENRGGNGKFI